MNFIATAALELLLLSVLAGLVGTLIVLRGQAFFAVALSHATFPGGVIAALVGVNVLLGQALAALILALILTWLTRKNRQRISSATGIILVFGFALGVSLSALQVGAQVPVEALLIGSLLGVQPSDIFAAAVVALLALGAMLVWGRQLLFATFDALGFRAAGFRADLPQLVTAVLCAAAVTVSMPAVGAILAVALLVGPALIAQLLVKNVFYIPPTAMLVGAACSALGLFLSSQFAIAAGGTISLVLATVFLLVLLLKKLLILLPSKF